MVNIKIIFRVFFLFCCLLSYAASAQEVNSSPDTIVESTSKAKLVIDIESEATSGIELKNTSNIDFDFERGTKSGEDRSIEDFYRSLAFSKIKHLYLSPNYRNLTKFYWKTNHLQESEDHHVDAFLLLTQCKSIKHFYNNDFQWKKIRNIGRRYIEKNKGNFPYKFKTVQQIKLGAYSFEQEGFKIIPQYAYNKSRRLRVTNNVFDAEDFCLPRSFEVGYLKEAPYNLVLSIASPFTLKNIPMSKKLSKTYLDYVNDNGLERSPYIVFYITPLLYKTLNFDINLSASYMAEYSGTLDYVEVYADSGLTRLLYREDRRK